MRGRKRGRGRGGSTGIGVLLKARVWARIDVCGIVVLGMVARKFWRRGVRRRKRGVVVVGAIVREGREQLELAVVWCAIGVGEELLT